jgi:Xaa-Pro dipeptidase
MPLAELYLSHVAEQMRRADVMLERAGRSHLVIASGNEIYAFLDDQTYPYRANPHFLAWVPLTHHPGSWITYTPGERPVLVYHQPEDYWHAPPAPPEGYWTEAFDVRVVRSAEAAAEHLPPAGHSVILGERGTTLPGFEPDNPEGVLAFLHLMRTRKTAYEIELMRRASRRGAHGHLAAREAFLGGASEHEIHLRYLDATQHTDGDLPYANIVALNEHAAVLHYHHTPGPRPAESRSFLIDAGARESGYASDITRTWARAPGAFADLIEAVDVVQQTLAGSMRAGRDYRELHVEAHRLLAGVLRDAGIVRLDPEAQLAAGITSTFFPHGLGHYLGIQVHDVAGFQKDEGGGTIPRPPGHPYLRLTRVLEPGNVVTVEPGLYFIPMLLERLRAGEHARHVDWAQVDALLPFGGIRIEDDVHVTEGAPENLTRDAFAKLAV